MIKVFLSEKVFASRFAKFGVVGVAIFVVVVVVVALCGALSEVGKGIEKKLYGV